VVLAAGADNLQDPFNPMGRADPLETAALLVMAGHLLPEEAYRAVSGASRTALGLRAAASLRVSPGDPAELVAVPAASVRAAEADQPGSRLVVHRGRCAGTPITSSG
jgi:cytosine deaminase